MPVLEGLWASVPYSYATVTRRRRAARIGEDIAERLKSPLDREHHRVQRAAALSFDAVDHLPAISVPTLVVHGEEDRLVPLENGRLLAAAIPDARLHTLTDAGHLYMTDQPGADDEVIRFMLEHPPPVRLRGPSDSGRAARA
jgi:pimeloyl-ACP methyl ester carboxylesterase